ncbi:MAG TPA: hypothetical protein VGV59_09615 [Pyrinomonadaceae bacterium]|nr:hypothetical protein [Pyrinomonadaceae bacterium]
MRATRRRARSLSPFASTDNIRSVCVQLRERCGEIIPRTDRQLYLMLEAVRNIERRPASDTKRGRPSRWPREQLLEVARHLRAILERETSGRISLQSFIAQHLRVLRFPADVQAALAGGDINLQEAAQLARLTAEKMACSPSEARKRRAEILQSHLALQGSQNRLRRRVKELLGELRAEAVTSENMASIIGRVDELLEIDPADARHMFWEEMKRLFFAMREIEPQDLDEKILNDFMVAMDNVSNVLYRIELRRRKREQQQQQTRRMEI